MMDRGLLVFGALFLALPALLLLGAMIVPAAAFALVLVTLALLTLGFLTGIAFVDLG